jgi:chromosome partitioning protein
MKVISVYNSKGGIGKTFISENLAYSLARRGFKVLAIDFDQQGGMTKHFGVNFKSLTLNGIHTLIGKAIENERITKVVIDACILKPTYMGKVMVKPTQPYADVCLEYGVDLLPMTKKFEQIKPLENCPEGVKGTYLLRIVSLIEQFYDYDYTIVDCSPVFGTISTNGLFLNNSYVLIPVSDFDSACAVSEIESKFNDIRALALKHNVNWGGPLGVVLNKFNLRDQADANIYEHRETLFKNHFLLNTIIPNLNSQARLAVQSKFLMSTTSKRARDTFDLVADEVLDRINTLEGGK